jgi:hypothetical protein
VIGPAIREDLVYTPLLAALIRAVRCLLSRTHQSDRRSGNSSDGGYATETVLVTALLVMLAVAVLAVLTTKVLAKVNSIDLG